MVLQQLQERERLKNEMFGGVSVRDLYWIGLGKLELTHSIGALSSFEKVSGWGKEFEEHLLLLQPSLLPLTSGAFSKPSGLRQ